MNRTISESMEITLNRLVERVENFLPGFFAALLIAFIGFGVALVAGKTVGWILRTVKFDGFCEDTGAAGMLSKADIREKPSVLVGRLVFWLLFLVFLMTGIGAMGLDVWNHLVEQFFLYLPRIFTAMFILLGGFIAANFISRGVLLAAVNAGMPSPRILSAAAKFFLALLSFSMALEQLEIAKGVVTSAFAIAFGAFMLALALAFGLGGRDVARKLLEKGFVEKEEERDKFSHL